VNFPDFLDLIVLFVNPIDGIYKKLFSNHLNNNEVDKWAFLYIKKISFSNGYILVMVFKNMLEYF